MTIAKGTTAAKKTALNVLGDTADKAHVTEEHITTKTYVADKPKDKDENETANGNAANQNSADTARTAPPVFTAQAAPKNRLADLFTDLRDYEETENETFYAMITRRPDMMNDNFRSPCLSLMQFPPLQINSSMMFQFIPLLQKYNGNSGGRFDVLICDTTGEQLEGIGLSGLVIVNPTIDEQPAQHQNGLDVVSFLREMNEANAKRAEESERRFMEMIKAMQPKEDEFTLLAKEKLRNDILSPKESTEFNPTKILEQVFTTTAVMQGMGEGFAKMFNKEGNSEKDRGLIESLLTNEMFMDKASDFATNITDTLAEVAVAFKTGAPPPQQHNAYQQPDTGTVHQIPTNEQQMKEQERIQLIKSIITELESDRPLNNENELLVNLKSAHADIYGLLKIACTVQTFEQLVGQLETIAPDEFNTYYDDDELNEKGKHVNERLKAFYDFMKSPAA